MQNRKFEPINIRLKDNSEVTIREARIEDAANLIKLVGWYLEESDNLLPTNDEFKPKLEDEIKWVESFLSANDSLLLVAESDGMLIGNLDISAGNKIKTKHIASLGVGVIKQYWHNGLGTTLLENALKWAKDMSKLEIIWLQVFSSNKRAIALYEKFGFTKDGIQNDFIKQPDGGYSDIVLMSLKLKQL